MKLHPYKEFAIETSLTKDEVVERLNSLKRPKKRWFWNKIPEVVATLKKPEKRHYTVEFNGDDFAIYIDFNIRGLGFITDFFRGDTELKESPKINGEIIQNGKFTNVRFGFKPPFYHLLFFYIFVFLGIAVGTVLLIIDINNDSIIGVLSVVKYILSPLTPAVILYFVLATSLNDYYNNMRPFLTELFEDN